MLSFDFLLADCRQLLEHLQLPWSVLCTSASDDQSVPWPWRSMWQSKLELQLGLFQMRSSKQYWQKVQSGWLHLRCGQCSVLFPGGFMSFMRFVLFMLCKRSEHCAGWGSVAATHLKRPSFRWVRGQQGLVTRLGLGLFNLEIFHLFVRRGVSQDNLVAMRGCVPACYCLGRQTRRNIIQRHCDMFVFESSRSLLLAMRTPYQYVKKHYYVTHPGPRRPVWGLPQTQILGTLP